MISLSLESYGIFNSLNNYQLSSYELQSIIIKKKMGIETKSGVLAINTGYFTGRSPDDRFIVKDSITDNKIWWDKKFNIPFDPMNFDKLYKRMVEYLSGKELYIRDGYLCSDKRFNMNIRSINEYPWSDFFIYNLFFRLNNKFNENFLPNWLLLCAPGFQSNTHKYGTRKGNFSILNFSKKIILIGGSGYTGEIKKSVFSVLNFTLPYKNVFPMHCAANVGKHKKDTALFFGLSGTGKTTISNDFNRNLIGDDEHGWTYDDIIFNFEGGCYAKIFGISKEKEPMIYNAIRKGAILENVILKKNKEVDFFNDSITENIRISYPIHFINNIEKKLSSSNIKNIFFLTYDAFGVLPPIAKLNKEQSTYYFLLGYTSKVAGTELNIKEPVATFSSCFGAPFMPLHPIKYTNMLMDKLNNNSNISVWMINTGLITKDNKYFFRIKLNDTRRIVKNVLDNFLLKVPYEIDPIFRFKIPKFCPGVSSNILNPRNIWKCKEMYKKKVRTLINKFNDHFSIYKKNISSDILSGAPNM
ncbi:phosphoenolpyruvate carboxykinase (ATP) [Blattabacterium cuenoti]|uniref:phosphoenolpyruvate carboxykinase (ATP) n=1 Tax=Blattabacterium cuenoti TaxID=1653831 RepID=UPI00163CA790|nr:phosphoenolpyruvate carboxykinase (ATP) [Blattabacterium cuenoti]